MNGSSASGGTSKALMSVTVLVAVLVMVRRLLPSDGRVVGAGARRPSPRRPVGRRLLDRGLLALQVLDGDLGGGAVSRRCPARVRLQVGRSSDALVARRPLWRRRVSAGGRGEVGPALRCRRPELPCARTVPSNLRNARRRVLACRPGRRAGVERRLLPVVRAPPTGARGKIERAHRCWTSYLS